jgi:ornithine carbamoyltransferase
LLAIDRLDETARPSEQTMAFNLHNRSPLAVQDCTQHGLLYLLDLARDLKHARVARTEQRHRVATLGD